MRRRTVSSMGRCRWRHCSRHPRSMSSIFNNTVREETMSITRRELLISGAAAAGAVGLGTVGFPGAALADWKPRRPIEIVVPSAPGGGQDLAARTLQGIVEQLKLSSKPFT